MAVQPHRQPAYSHIACRKQSRLVIQASQNEQLLNPTTATTTTTTATTTTTNTTNTMFTTTAPALVGTHDHHSYRGCARADGFPRCVEEIVFTCPLYKGTIRDP